MSVRGSRVVSWMIIAVFVGVAASATPVPATLTFRVTAVDPGITAVAVGDRITLQFTVDDSVVDTNAGVGAGTFPSLMTAASGSAAAENSGSWTPSGTFDLAGSNYVTNAYGDNFTFEMSGTGFPDGGAGLPFLDFDLGFQVPFDLTDSGLGDTFAQQLGGTPIDFASYFRGGSIRFEDGIDYKVATLALASDEVPALGGTGLAALALLLAVAGIVALRAFSA